MASTSFSVRRPAPSGAAARSTPSSGPGREPGERRRAGPGAGAESSPGGPGTADWRAGLAAGAASRPRRCAAAAMPPPGSRPCFHVRPPSRPEARRPVPTATVSPSSASTRARTPAAGEGASEVALSVSTMKSASPASTWSPTSLSQPTIVPCSMVSPRTGIVTSMITARRLSIRGQPADQPARRLDEVVRLRDDRRFEIHVVGDGDVLAADP